MGTFGFVKLGVLIIFVQTFAPGSLEEPTCRGFDSDLLVFKVSRMQLHWGRVLGKVGFDDCSGRTRFLFDTDDKRFRVEPDGTLKLKRPVALHARHKDFSVHAWDSQGTKRTVLVRVQLHGREHHHSLQNQDHQNHHGHQNQEHHGQQNQEHHGHQNQDHQNHHGHQNHNHHGSQNHNHHGHQHGHQNHSHHGHHHGHQNHSHHGQSQGHLEHQSREVDSATETQASESPAVPVLIFHKATAGLKRRKRAWVIPPINTPENERGLFPKVMVQIRSDNDKEVKILYSIQGPGADQPPLGLFTIDRTSGVLYVTQPLDREKQDKYTIQAHAVAEGLGVSEEPMDIIIKVIDMNDNKPVFAQDPFLGTVPEASPLDFEFMKVVATDADEPGNANSDVRYEILSQEPQLPSPNMFTINPVTGGIRVKSASLDREKNPKYTLEVQAADMEGNGLVTRGKVVITVSDSNDNAPQFVQTSYTATVPENQVDALVVKMPVTDDDDPHSPAWEAVFSIAEGDPDGLFSITTGPNKQEGIITTAKALDFEKNSKYTLLVKVFNAVPFAKPLTTATATVVVTVLDVNEAPAFNPVEKVVVKKEDLAVNSVLVLYTATDPDTARKQTLTYKVQKDPAGWLSVKKDTGQITVKSSMDRESHFVVDGKYTALISAVDSDDIPATGTGTLLIQLEDVNDNAPIILERNIDVCNQDSFPQHLSVTDKDGPAPYTVSLQGTSGTNWTARMNDSKTGIILTLVKPLEQGHYTVVLSVADNGGMEQTSTLLANVCDCKGKDVVCPNVRAAAVPLSGVLGILGAILLLLLLGLILLMFMRRRTGEKKEPLLQDDDVRDNIYYYDEEGGGEDDQDYDLSVLHRGLDNRPDVFRNDVVPPPMPAPHHYRPRPANPEDIGCFIDDNLKAADNDPTAPPYDSLLVFDYEGGGSEAGSLSSLNSSSSGDDQDYDVLQQWGPRFKKLADMYGGGEDDML